LNQAEYQKQHDRYAPYWAAAMILFGLAGLAPNWFDTGTFWESFGLDICGPAWNYILFRRLGTAYRDNRWVRFFTPLRTVAIFILVAYGIEGMQYLQWYDSTYDSWDLLAYISLLIPLFLLDLTIIKQSANTN
jgi:hypothetical protein